MFEKMIEGLSHITLIVQDLERTSSFLETVFDAKEVYSSDNKNFSLSREKFFLVGRIWIAIMEGISESRKTYDHIAFKIPDEDYPYYVKRIKQAGVEIKQPRPRVKGEGRSIYFYDHDNHLFELHTGSLEERMNCYNNTGSVQ